MTDTLDNRLKGSLRGHVLQEFFSNSAHFPLVNIFLELLLQGPSQYVLEADPYILLFVAAAQATVLGRWQYRGRPRPLLGNLVGPALYTLLELPLDGLHFFAHPHHIAYWVFAASIGALQQARLHLHGRGADAAILLENLVRTSILLVMYIILEALQSGYPGIGAFLDDPPHVFVTVVIPLLGLTVGFAHLTSQRYLERLRDTAQRLRQYSQWLLGKDLLDRAVADPHSLTLARRQRALLFADIRGFTAWSESHPPEAVVELINRFYERAEPVWLTHGTVKVKLTADELMLVFEGVSNAVAAALELRQQLGPMLRAEGLEFGTGIHTGAVIEGLMGSGDQKSFDVIGDSVNTAKRLCDAAGPGEILISDPVHAELENAFRVSGSRQLELKGKRAPVTAYLLTASA